MRDPNLCVYSPVCRAIPRATMMTAAQQRWYQQRQFAAGDWGDGDEDTEASSENYFPEPMDPSRRTRLPDISGQPTGIHLGPKRGRLVTFYRNGDPHFRGLSASISQKAFVTMESLLVWLNEKIPTTAGVRHVFRMPDGRRVREVAEFQPGGHYVVSSVRRLVRGPNYGAEAAADPQQQQSRSHQSSVAGNIRPADIRLLARADQTDDATGARRFYGHNRRSPPDGSGIGRGGAVRLITVVSNSHRNSREKVLVNPATRLNFEDLLADFTSLLVMSGPPVCALYTASPPYRRVESFSQLFREFRDHDTFIACGRELTPVELTAGLAAPKRADDGAASAARNTTTSTEKAPAKLPRRPDEDWQLHGTYAGRN